MHLRLLLIFFALLCLATPAQTEGINFQKDGVKVRTFTLSNSIVFCFSAEPNFEIPSEYGVNFIVPDDEKKAWNEPLPKLVTKEGWYFDLPLRVEIKTLASAINRHVNLDLGACYGDKYCNLVAFDIEIPFSQPMNEAPCSE